MGAPTAVAESKSAALAKHSNGAPRHPMMREDGIIIIVMHETRGWSAGSPQLGPGFVVLGPTREDVVAKIEALLTPLAEHGLMYRFLGQTNH